MSSWDDVRRTALALPETGEGESRGWMQWLVRRKAFVWERPLGRADRVALGDGAPDGDILAAYVPDLGVKEALLAEDPHLYFTTPHFDGYPAVLARLERLDADNLDELVTEAWLCRAPRRLAAAHLETLDRQG